MDLESSFTLRGKPLPVARQLVLLAALVAVLIIAGAMVALWGIGLIKGQYDGLAMEHIAKVSLAAEIARGASELDMAVRGCEQVAIGRAEERVRTSVEALRPLIRTPEEKQRLDGLLNHWRYYGEMVAAGKPVSPERLKGLTTAADSHLALERRELAMEVARSTALVRAVVSSLGLVVLGALLTLLVLALTAGRKVLAATTAVENVVQHTCNAVLIVDHHFRITSVNPMFEQLVFRSRARLLNKPYDEVCSDLYPLSEVFFRGERRENDEVRFVAPNGETRYFLADAVPWIGRQGKVMGGMLSLRDITARKMAELEKQAELAEMAMHDPLTGLFNQRYLMKRLEEEVEHARENGTDLALIMLDIDYFKIFNDTWGHPCGDKLLRELASVLVDSVRRDDVVARYGGDEFVIILPGTDLPTANEAAARIRAHVSSTPFSGREVLPGGQLTVSVGAAAFADGSDAAELIRRADEAMYEAKWVVHTRVEELPSPTEEACHYSAASADSELPGLNAVLQMIEAHDRYTYRHSHKVVQYSICIGQELGLNEREMSFLRLAAFLHDIGKVCIPMAILTKPGHLTDEEWSYVRRHPIYGASLLRAFHAPEPVVLAVLHHHERWDGAGYPSGTEGAGISLLARIIAMADSFDAMLSTRPYRKPLTLKEAMAEIEANAGRQFDPEVTAVFLSLCWDKFALVNMSV